MLIGNIASKFRSKAGMAALACAAALGGMMVAAPPAQAWWRGGVWVGVPVPPVVIGAPGYYPPYYYPPYYPYPPAYYPPPAAYPQSTAAAPPQSAPDGSKPVAYGSTCYAGVYICTAPGNTPVGSGCSCPALGAPSYGTVR